MGELLPQGCPLQGPSQGQRQRPHPEPTRPCAPGTSQQKDARALTYNGQTGYSILKLQGTPIPTGLDPGDDCISLCRGRRWHRRCAAKATDTIALGSGRWCRRPPERWASRKMRQRSLSVLTAAWVGWGPTRLHSREPRWLASPQGHPSVLHQSLQHHQAPGREAQASELYRDVYASACTGPTPLLFNGP